MRPAGILLAGVQGMEQESPLRNCQTKHRLPLGLAALNIFLPRDCKDTYVVADSHNAPGGAEGERDGKVGRRGNKTSYRKG